MIVVDAGVWLAALVDDSPLAGRCRTALTDDTDWLVPAQCPLEVLRGLRRYERTGVLSSAAADTVAERVCRAAVRVAAPDETVLRQVWRMRQDVSVDDAAYLVLAAQYGVTLVTCDPRLAKAAQQREIAARLIR